MCQAVEPTLGTTFKSGSMTRKMPSGLFRAAFPASCLYAVHPVRTFDSLFTGCKILHGRIHFLMTGQDRYLLDRHSAVQQTGNSCTPEPVRMDILNTGGFLQLFEHGTDSTRLKTFATFTDKQGFVAVIPCQQVFSEHQHGNVIQENGAFLIAFTKDDALSFIQINIVSVQPCYFTDPTACSQQETDDRIITDGFAAAFQQFYLRR